MNRNKSCNTNTCSLPLTSFFSHVRYIGTVAAIHMISMTDRNHTGRSLINYLNLSCDSQIVPFFFSLFHRIHYRYGIPTNCSIYSQASFFPIMSRCSTVIDLVPFSLSSFVNHLSYQLRLCCNNVASYLHMASI